MKFNSISFMFSFKGDVLLATAFLSYSGPFNQQFRNNLLSDWQQELQQRCIPFCNNLNLIELLIDAPTVSEWNLQVSVQHLDTITPYGENHYQPWLILLSWICIVYLHVYWLFFLLTGSAEWWPVHSKWHHCDQSHEVSSPHWPTDAGKNLDQEQGSPESAAGLTSYIFLPNNKHFNFSQV